nr:MAG TPA: hypothetical protein [Caudoviricetes sp.]
MRKTFLLSSIYLTSSNHIVSKCRLSFNKF